MHKLLATLTLSCLLLTSCARNMAPNTMNSSATVGKVLEGTVVSAQAVTIQDKDKLEDNGMGMLGGGLLGAVIGSGVGKGTGQSVAAASGALVGAAAGAMLQSQLSKSQGMQYIVKIDPQHVKDISTVTSKIDKRQYSTSSVEDDVNKSINLDEMHTDLLSVTQGNEIVFTPGQRVYIMYNNDRPRLVAAY